MEANAKGAAFTLRQEKDTIFVTGDVTRETAPQLVKLFKEDRIYTLDFAGVERINFGGQRVLLHASQTGKKFNIVNAGVKVKATLSSTGVDTFISVLEKPVELSMQGYEIFGGGFNGDSYYGADGDDMLKLYTQAASAAECEQEKRYARTAFLAGIPTPLSGELVTADGRRGVTFERIQGKKSISRLLADNPDKIEQYAKDFAELCQNLHRTPCNRAAFPSVDAIIRRVILDLPAYSDKEKTAVLHFMDGIPETGTCLHGDLHIGNVIWTPDGDYLFIDMGDFGYGNPLLDLGMTYFVMRCPPAKMMDNVLHNTPETMAKFWNLFVKYYAGVETPEQVAAFTENVLPFVGLRAMFLMTKARKDPLLVRVAREFLLDKIM